MWATPWSLRVSRTGPALPGMMTVRSFIGSSGLDRRAFRRARPFCRQAQGRQESGPLLCWRHRGIPLLPARKNKAGWDSVSGRVLPSEAGGGLSLRRQHRPAVRYCSPPAWPWRAADCTAYLGYVRLKEQLAVAAQKNRTGSCQGNILEQWPGSEGRRRAAMLFSRWPGG